MDPTVEFACELIRRPSVTPEDAGCQAHIGKRLEAAGFRLESMPFGEVDNLWAVAGDSGPICCFAGHTDVVPPGPLENWSGDPFEPRVLDGQLYGRGAADMKGSVAAMVTAAERFRAAQPDHSGRLAILLTSDEEGPSVDGTRRVVETLTARGEQIDWCVVGEPSSETRLADVIKNGRRGSLTGRLSVHGIQGHVAYPDAADNALHRLIAILEDLLAVEWDNGDAHFPPTSLQIANLAAGTGASNVIPGRADAEFNLRYSPALDADTIRARVEAICRNHGAQYDLEWHHSGSPFITEPGTLVEAVQAAAHLVTGVQPRLSTAGGTSDGRFIAPTGAEVVELGPVNATIHQADEHVDLESLASLSDIYEAVMKRVLQ